MRFLQVTGPAGLICGNHGFLFEAARKEHEDTTEIMETEAHHPHLSAPPPVFVGRRPGFSWGSSSSQNVAMEQQELAGEEVLQNATRSAFLSLAAAAGSHEVGTKRLRKDRFISSFL